MSACTTSPIVANAHCLRSSRRNVKAGAVVPGKGPGSPRWYEIHEELVSSSKVREATADDVQAIISGSKRNGVVIDVRQSLEHEEWRIPGTMNVPYLVPFENPLRRASGYFLSIKGGLKERNKTFVDEMDVATSMKKNNTVILVDLRGGDLDIEPNVGSTSVSDAGDSNALRAAYELVQSGYRDVRYIKGGFRTLIEEGSLPWESEKYGGLLERVSDGTRQTLMYSNLLPDPSLAPGVLVQVFALLVLAVLQGGDSAAIP